MSRIPRIPVGHLAGCALVGVIALATAWGWLAVTGQRTLSVSAIVACTAVSVALTLGAEHTVRRLHRGRARRAHARPHPNTRKAA